jgi:hypothetical protein
MKVLAREGTTVSLVVRNTWDSKRLQTINRSSPLPSDAHIGIIGHMTKDELRRYLAATELADGFFHRFLVIAVQRSKLLPLGGQLVRTRPRACPRACRARAAARKARSRGLVHRRRASSGSRRTPSLRRAATDARRSHRQS